MEKSILFTSYRKVIQHIEHLKSDRYSIVISMLSIHSRVAKIHHKLGRMQQIKTSGKKWKEKRKKYNISVIEKASSKQK